MKSHQTRKSVFSRKPLLKTALTALVCLSPLACNAPNDPLPGEPAPQPTATAQPLPGPSPTSTPSPTPTTTPTPSPTPSTGKPIALVYGGPGVLTGTGDTLEMAKVVAGQAGFQVITVTGPVPTATLNSASVWVQPGGPNLYADSFMNGNGMANQVRDFVRRGGGYVGFCGGAFSAMNNLKLIPGSASNLSESTGKIPINWLGAIRYIHFEGGPYLKLTDPASEIVGTYANGSVAAARAYYGNGKVFISGVHPEANKYWPPTYDPDGLDQDLAIGMIQEVAALPEAQ